MNRNEYRRAFIMLRAAIQGYGGHVRLERRTLTGSMYFVVTAPQGVNELSAALVGRQNGNYFATSIGPLARDRRGQLTLAWQFDPRSIDGRPLEAYAWVAVAATGGPCAVALIGNVESSRPMDPEALGRAVCALFASPTLDAPAADLPEPGASFPEEMPETAPPEGTAHGDIKIYTRSRARLRSAIRQRAEVVEEARTDAEAVPEETPVVAEAPVTAARQLGLDITSPLARHGGIPAATVRHPGSGGMPAGGRLHLHPRAHARSLRLWRRHDRTARREWPRHRRAPRPARPPGRRTSRRAGRVRLDARWGWERILGDGRGNLIRWQGDAHPKAFPCR